METFWGSSFLGESIVPGNVESGGRIDWSLNGGSATYMLQNYNHICLGVKHLHITFFECDLYFEFDSHYYLISYILLNTSYTIWPLEFTFYMQAYNNNTKGPLLQYLWYLWQFFLFVLAFIDNFCGYDVIVCMTSFRGKVLFKIAQIPIGQFCLTWWVTWLVVILPESNWLI